MAIDNDVGLDDEILPHDPLHREPAPIDLRTDLVDDDPRRGPRR
jgi:hypothetical protein